MIDDGIGDVLAALADPTRRQLLDVLADTGRASATALAARLPVSRQAVVKHLQVLEAAGLVTGARAGREVRYAVRREPLDASARWLADLASTWDRRLRTVKQAAEDPAPIRGPLLGSVRDPGTVDTDRAGGPCL